MGEEGELSINEAMKKKEESIPRAFKKLMKDNGIKDKTVDVLVQNDIDSISAISTLSVEDIASLGLTLGQRNLLKKCIENVNSPISGPEEGASNSSEIKSTSVKSAKEMLSAAVNPTKQSNGESLPNLPCSVKPSNPVARPMHFIEGKKNYSELSLSEHIYASLLILENMLVAGEPDTIAYTRHLSFLALKSSQHFSTESILTYDNAVRSAVDTSGKWPHDSDVHLANCHLVRSLRAPNKAKDRRSKPTGNTPQTNICFRFNAGNCESGDRCRYEHKCLTCNGGHPVSSCNRGPQQKSQKPQ